MGESFDEELVDALGDVFDTKLGEELFDSRFEDICE